jgi:hypothetical protein
MKKGITIKVPVDEVEESIDERITGHLKSNQKFAYTISGLMVELFGYKPEDLDASFKDWSKGAPSQYTRIRIALERLKKERKIEAKKQGRRVLYWWKKEN